MSHIAKSLTAGLVRQEGRGGRRGHGHVSTREVARRLPGAERAELPRGVHAAGAHSSAVSSAISSLKASIHDCDQAGADADERAALSLLRAPSDYALLASSGCFANPDWGDDARECEAAVVVVVLWRCCRRRRCCDLGGIAARRYSIMRTAMGRIGVESGTQREAMAILAAVLHLGNVTFKQAMPDLLPTYS